MYKKNKPEETSLRVNNSYIGETIEEKVGRIMNNKEPISDGAPLIFTERKDGVLPDYDIRTDKWEAVVEAMERTQKDKIEKRQAKIIEMQKKKTENPENNTEKSGDPSQ
jgi:histidinol dehydrogenase